MLPIPKRILWFILLIFVLTNGALADGFSPKQLEEATIAEIHAAMQSGRVTAVQLVRMYLDRIAAYDKTGPALNSIIALNARALETAADLDRRFAQSGRF